MIDDESMGAAPRHTATFLSERRKMNRVLRSGGMCRLGNDPLLNDRT